MSLYKYDEIRETDTLVNKIVQQGQKLRNALVQSILNNDPFSVDILTSQTNSERTARTQIADKADQERLEAYLAGEFMSREEEQEILNTVQSMSAADLCKITEHSYEKFKPCDCKICTAYMREDFSCDLKRPRSSVKTSSRSESSDITKAIQETYRSRTESYLKYVDSVQIGIHNLTLNDVGTRKVTASEVDNKIKLSPSINHTYFVEYRVPDAIVNKVQAKFPPGVDNNFVRLCSKKLHHDAIYFKTLSVHDITNLDRIALRDVDVTFRVSCRTLKQKETNVLGVAKFNLGAVELSKYVSCSQRLPITLNEDSPVVVGHLKVFVKLGCGRLYFGKEFVEAVFHGKENTVAPIDSSSSTLEEKFQSRKASPVKNSPKKDQPTQTVTAKFDKATLTSCRDNKSVQMSARSPKIKLKNSPVAALQPEITEVDKQVLFGFLYVSEAQYLDRQIDSYITCRPFCLDETVCSRLISSSENCVFDFSQRIPLLYEDELLRRFHENHMIIEFWEKTDETDFVFGLTKISLNQLYVAFRNPIIVKYLLKNKLPVVNTDWWEPIVTIEENKTIGRVQVLLALGSEEQIKNLETERGFKQEIVRSKPKALPFKQPKKYPQPQEKITKKSPFLSKVDVGVQSDMEDKNPPRAQEKMEEFLSQLLTQKQKNVYVENATNTDPAAQNCDDDSAQLSRRAAEATNVQLRKTSDLLDSLQKALSLRESPVQEEECESFKAHITVENALHLPIRKKCKSRKSKSKIVRKQEECLPSTYVTFETVPGTGLKITPVVHKTTNPKWNYTCDVALPRELLTNLLEDLTDFVLFTFPEFSHVSSYFSDFCLAKNLPQTITNMLKKESLKSV